MILGKVKRELPPHDGYLHITSAKQQLACVKRPAWGVADLPVGLDNHVSGGELLLHVPVDIGEHLRKKALRLFAKSQGITILGKPLDEILGQVGTPNHS